MKQGDLFEEDEDEDLTLWKAIKQDPKHSSMFLVGILIFFWIILR